MADRTPRYPFDTPFASGAPREGDGSQAVLPPEELATRRWMLIFGGAGVFALVVAAASVFAFGGSSSSTPAAISIVPGSATAASGAVAAAASATSTTAESGDAARLAEARSTIAKLESQLQAARERGDDLDRRLVANEQVLRITTNRADTADAVLGEQRAERADFQVDLDAMNSALTEANADRAALRAQLSQAEAQSSGAKERAAASDARAASLAISVDALYGCLKIHQQALYYTTLDNWGLLATAMQEAAVSCYQDLG